MKFRILLAALAVLLAPGIRGVRAQDAGLDRLAWMLENLPECPAFESWLTRTGALPPDFEALPRTNLLPDAFTFADGTPVVTDADWERRRAEILDLFIRYEFGTLPPRPGWSRWRGRNCGCPDRTRGRRSACVRTGFPGPPALQPSRWRAGAAGYRTRNG